MFLHLRIDKRYVILSRLLNAPDFFSQLFKVW